MVYMPHPFVIFAGKTVRAVARLRGGGSALPGLFVEKIDPDFIQKTLAKLPHGTVVISGTNGKTTTTKMVVSLLEANGLRVFTNRTGSNFTRGVAAALLKDVSLKGELAADIAVLELDEAHAVKFVERVQPRHSLILNVMRDQLDRFGEIDATAELLSKIAAATTESVTLNREDPRIRRIASLLDDQAIEYFGLSDELLASFPSDDDLRSTAIKAVQRPAADVILQSYEGSHATFLIDKKEYTTPLKITGVYNVFNSAAALATTKAILGKAFDPAIAITALANVTPAFGRGEILKVNGHPLELVLVKNPSGFRLGLSSFSPNGYATMIAVNDNYADGRDMSWLWDVDFDSLKELGVSQVSGIRAYDIALRLQYDEITIAHVDPDLTSALKQFIGGTPGPRRIYCTYTAMLTIRRDLSKITNVEVIT
jgi:UDP-N-acetylmuramyl tripeptide synthase